MTGNQLPQPGATPGAVHLPFSDIAAPGGSAHEVLTKGDAINFNDAKFQWLPQGTVLHRVWGGPAYDTGSYWSPVPLAANATEAEWRGHEAVAQGWNAGTEQATLTIKKDNRVGGWFGTVAAQPAQDTSGSIYLPGYELAGGGQQVKVIYPAGWTYKDKDTDDLVITDTGSTPWSNAAAIAPRAARKVATGALASTQYASLDAALAALSDALRSTTDGLDDAHVATRLAQADNVDIERGNLEADVVDDGRLDASETQQHVRALRGLPRHVEFTREEVAIVRAMQNVTEAAHALL